MQLAPVVRHLDPVAGRDARHRVAADTGHRQLLAGAVERGDGEGDRAVVARPHEVRGAEWPVVVDLDAVEPVLGAPVPAGRRHGAGVVVDGHADGVRRQPTCGRRDERIPLVEVGAARRPARAPREGAPATPSGAALRCRRRSPSPRAQGPRARSPRAARPRGRRCASPWSGAARRRSRSGGTAGPRNATARSRAPRRARGRTRSGRRRGTRRGSRGRTPGPGPIVNAPPASEILNPSGVSFGTTQRPMMSMVSARSRRSSSSTSSFQSASRVTRPCCMRTPA